MGQHIGSSSRPCIECKNDLSVTLKMDETKTYFDSRTPTQEELNYCVNMVITNSWAWETSIVDLKVKSISSVINPCNYKIHQQVSSVSISHGVPIRLFLQKVTNR